MEFEWKILPRFETMGILNKIQQIMDKLKCAPENFQGRIIFMSMFNDGWKTRGNEELCENNSKSVSEYAGQFPRGHWSFL